MLINKELKQALFYINGNKVTQFSYAGSLFTLKVSEKKDAIEISAPVYWGGNYIPHSVRACIAKRAPFDEKIIETFLTVDEENFQIDLHHVDSQVHFDELFEEFSFLVNEWKEWLDQHDKNDLVHVYNRK